ncbi:formylglycine-generating enzyme family protein [Fusobacterium periodonticum]|uniref:formylglycine-generating enzyme family protein n=1 Tax=Fusobacterium periodonticum TaxID=860 RepID=UPI00195F10D9|nr:SUMF1/EgtB/PvdO family nonheme iron enzyme [Fusobacterium periodonticum]VTX71554.1 Formylglycine-generating sulfatase enzyme [Fusobacterium periodonticum]
MKESISKFITEGKALLWIKTNDFQEVERAMIESLNSLENKKFYIYEKGKTINFLNDSIESGMDDLYNTLDELYPQGIRKIPVFLLIKGGIDEILKKNNLDYFREIVETKKEAPRYNFTVVIADNEDVPPQLEDMVDFIDKQITDNEGAIKKYILDLAKFEKLELDENNIEKIIKELKGTIKKYSGKKASNVESKFEDMVFVQGGKYQPSFADEEKEVFDIEVCKYPTTQKMWIEVMENNPSQCKGDNKPVESITWWQALDYCNKLSEKYGLEPVYDLSKSAQGILMIKELDGITVYPDVANFKNTEGFRLPTEVEWEWFARGGQIAIEQGTFDYTYSGSNNINEVAWYSENLGVNKSGVQDVGLKKPNQLGLYDCTGNVWEMCYDTSEIGIDEGRRYYENIEKGSSYMYKAFDSSNMSRRVKGGSHAYYSSGWNVLSRNVITATYAYNSSGFRIVRTV